MIIITGMHRSGTTLLGRLICKSFNKFQIYEPFNKELGIEGIDNWYFFTPKKSNRCNNSRVIKEFFNNNSNFKTPKLSFDSNIKSILRKLFKSNANVDYQIYKLYKNLGLNKELVIKDPFVLLSIPHILYNYENVKVIINVRHPVSVYRSIKRMDWRFNFKSFMNQKELIKTFDKKLIEEIQQELDLASEVAYLWKILYKNVIEILKSNNENVFLLNWENFCNNPDSKMECIKEFLNVKNSTKVNELIKKYMFNESDKINESKLHNFYRDSKKVAIDYKIKLKEEEKIILKICDKEIKHFYSD